MNNIDNNINTDINNNIINNNTKNNINIKKKIDIFNKLYPTAKYYYISALINPGQTFQSRITNFK